MDALTARTYRYLRLVGNNAEIFRNRKGFFSINVQALCHPNMLITNIVCRWPGSTHYSRIFDNSVQCSQFENNLIDGLLLGDDGFPCRHYLMTPVNNPVTDKETTTKRILLQEEK